MIRNAIDHGLESPEQRKLAGKPELGTVRLAAMHRSGRIVIEVSDDGAGINRARVRESAIEKGLIAPDVVLSDEETDNLIFLAGFSTAATISDISDRGVGMDVVRRSIQALGGRIAITSRPGLGSTFTLSLPLTLAVLDGMVVTVADQTLIVPLTAIIETLQPRQTVIHDLGEGAQVLNIRGTYIRCFAWERSSAGPMAELRPVVSPARGGRWREPRGAPRRRHPGSAASRHQKPGGQLSTGARRRSCDHSRRWPGGIDLGRRRDGVGRPRRGTFRRVSLRIRTDLCLTHPSPHQPVSWNSLRSAREQEFCVDIMSVREIRGWVPVTPLPRSPSFVRGVINLRGAVLPILDLSARLGFR